MTTITQLVKRGKKNFIPLLEDLGFTDHDRLSFSRKTDEGVYQLILADLSYGVNLKFHITCIVKEYAPHKMDNFPRNINLTCGGRLGEGLVTGELWDVEELDEIDSIFEDITQNIIEHALPWFETINTRQDYVNAMTADARERAEDNGRMEAILTPPLDEQ